MIEKLPVDTDTKIYIENTYSYSIFDLLLKCEEKWGNVKMDDLKIDFEEIQIKCFGRLMLPI